MVGYLLQPLIQIENSDGKPLEGGKVYVYKLGITPPVLADTYFDFQGHLNTNPIILDSLGHCTIIAEDDTAYDVIIKNKDDELQFSIHNATVMGGSGEIVIENPEVSVVAGEGIAVSSSRGLDGVITYTVALGASVISHLNDIDVNIVNLQNEDIDIHNDIDVANTNIQNNSNAITQISTDLANTINTVISNTSRIEALENADDNTTYQLPLKKENNVVSNNGRDLTVTGLCAWAEGDYNQATGDFSHVEGGHNKAIGTWSHAGGYDTEARANYSTTQGNKTIANSPYETAIGTYNLDEGGHIFQVGIGDNHNRKDAFQIDTDGTIRYLYNDEMVQLKPGSDGNFVAFDYNPSGISNNSPAADCKTYLTNMENDKTVIAYCDKGNEYTIIFSKATSGNYGNIIKFGYTDKYIYILRNKNNVWQSEDWEKISAGYADNAGHATTADNATNADKVDNYHISVGSVGTDTSTIYFV